MTDLPFAHRSVPPSALSKKYYTLEAPDACAAAAPAAPSHAPPKAAPPPVAAAVGPASTPTRTVPVAPPYRVLPKHRRNKDDPGGVSGPLAQPTTLSEVGFVSLCLGENLGSRTNIQEQPGDPSSLALALGSTPGAATHQQPLPPPGVIVPSQSAHAALDPFRYSDSRDWTWVDTSPGACQPPQVQGLNQLPHAPSPTPTATPPPPTPSVEELASTDKAWNTTVGAGRGLIVYSPTTARRIPVAMGAAGIVLQDAAARPEAEPKTRHKRLASTPSACAFCKRRKIACGGPVPNDGARRCG